MYNPLVTGLFHQFPPLHSITRINFIKLRSCGTLIKDLQSLLYHYLHFTIWLQSVLSASPFAPPFPNHSKIHIIPKIFHLLSCCYGLLSLEMLTNPPTLFGKLPFLTQKLISGKTERRIRFPGCPVQCSSHDALPLFNRFSLRRSYVPFLQPGPSAH